MKVMVCDLPSDEAAFDAEWERLVQTLQGTPVDLLVLPEFAGVDAFWTEPVFDEGVWRHVLERQAWLASQLPRLNAQRVMGTLAEAHEGRRLNRTFVWTPSAGLQHGRAKAWLPQMQGGWEATWFDRGSTQIPVVHSEGLLLSTLVCTEVMVSGAARGLGRAGVQVIAVPRATGGHARWSVATRMAALSAGAFVLTANRTGPGFAGGSAIIGPDAQELAQADADHPFVTFDIALAQADQAKTSYPRNVIDPV